MSFLEPVSQALESVATNIPLELFVPLGSFIEELIAPIPSPVVMVLSGSLAKAQNHQFIYLLFLAVLGAIGKTVGAWILYVIADRLEDVIFTKFGKFIGVSHREVEAIGKKLSGGWKDDIFLFVARALPIVPSAPVSLACGLIKINLRTYIFSTFGGTTIRNMLYLYLGFVGLGNYKEIANGFEDIESVGQIMLFCVIAAVIIWAYFKRKKMNESHHETSLDQSKKQ